MKRFAAAAGALAATGVLAGCAGGEPPGNGSAPFTTGPAVADLTAYGQVYRPCTKLEAESYPTELARPSDQYYQGPWCATVTDSTVYLWTFARTPQGAMTDAQLAEEVNQDVDQMRLDLLAQGYYRVCGNVAADGDIDEGFESPGVPLAIRVISSGQAPARSSAAASAEPSAPAEPLALRVVLSPSARSQPVAEGEPAPPC